MLFCSLFILACSNDVSAPTTNITDVALHSLERSVNTKEGETFRFVFELNKTSIKDVVFDWYLQHHSTSADDFTGALAGTKRIIAGSTTTDIVIDTSDDNIYEGNEGFALSIINVIRAVPDSLSVVASIIDKDQPIILFKQDNTALEAASFNYRLRLNKASIKDVVFDWFIQHHSTSTGDFRGALAGSQLIRAGSTTATISIDTSDDTIYEGNEDFTLHITNVIGATPDSLLVDSSIIDDQDKPIISFEQAASTVTEGASFTYKLELGRASLVDVSFDWYVEHSSTSTSDFAGALTGSQLIRAGDTTATISIDTSDDNIYEGNEDFTLHITNVIGATPDALVASGSIIENDPQPTIDFEQDYSSVTEGGSLSYTLQLNQASALDVSFDWYLQYLSTSTGDFRGALAGTKRIRAGDTTATISIDTSNDNIYEGNEDFTLHITNITGATTDALAARGSIINNDSQPSITFEQDYSSVTEGGSLSYTLQLNQASALDVSFDWSVRHLSTSTGDFRGALAGSQLIRAGDTTATISIDTSDDSIYEGNEDFTLHITNITGATPDALVASGSIIENDPQPTIDFEQVASTVLEGASISYKLRLKQASALDVSFDWLVQHSSTSTSDFRGALAGSQLIRAGDTTATISIDTSDDNIYEGNEDFTLHITNVTGATPDALVASGSIIENDPQPTIDFEQVASTVLEGASISYKLRLNQASALDVSFDWYLQHSSTSTGDFRGALAGSQLIRAGSTTTDIVIDTSDDNIYEGNEDFTLHITNVIGATPDALVAGGRIIDNDPQPIISFEQVASTVLEGASISYKLRLKQASALDVSFDWSVRHLSTSTSDFTSILSGTKQIRAGDTTTTISIDTSDDSIYETDEIFTLNITNIRGATPDALVASGSIIENDPQPTIVFEQLASTVLEGASISYKLRLKQASALDASFDWSVRHLSTSTGDFTGALAGSQLIRAGDTTATISIDTSDDNIYEGNEDFTLHITNVTGATPDALVASGSIIENDPQPTIVFEQDYNSVTEGSSLSYTLQLNKVSALDVSFDWSVRHLSTSTGDFTGALAGTKQIRAGSTTTTISIDTSDDTIYEGDEEFILNITNITGATTDALAARGSIINNDSQPSITFEQDYSNVTEDGSLSYTLQLNKVSATNVSFDWSVQHISTSAEDFRGATFGAKILFARDTTATIELQINDDDRPELTEDFTLHITNIRGATPNSLSTLITIAESDIGVSVDYDGNGLIDLVTQEYFDNIRYNVAGTSYKTSTVNTGKNCGGNVCRGYELLANIALNTNWQPIGSTSDPFTSILQGNGYSITKLAINGGYFATDDRDYLGLFATLSGATIDNLVVEVTSISGNSYVGALAGSAANSIINKVQIRAANTNSKLSATGANIGGILGEITDATITNVTSDLNIVGGNKDSADYVGGIAGHVSSSDISHVYSSGSVFASGGADFVGGLVGELTNSTISYSSASGIVSSSGNNSQYYGGLVGNLMNSTISYSSASGSVSSNGGNSDHYGGLAGYVDHSSRISYSSASGGVSNSGGFSDNYGGLAGYVDHSSTINDSSASGGVSSSGENSNYYGGLVGYVNNSSAINDSSASGSVTSSGVGSDFYGGLVGNLNYSTISNSSASSSVSSSKENSDFYGGLVGELTDSAISYSGASGDVSSSGENSNHYGGLAGRVWKSSTISNSSASGSVSSSGENSNHYGGLVGDVGDEGDVEDNSAISYSGASGGVSSSGENSNYYGGLVGVVWGNSAISYSSASGSVSSSGNTNNRYGGLVGAVEDNSAISYSSASGSVSSSGNTNNRYGGLVGVSYGDIRHSWSSSSVFASSAAGLAGSNSGNLGFSYALGVASYGLVVDNYNTINDSYWNSETSGALAAGLDSTTNIASSDTAGMLASTGSAGARIFKGFFDATDEHNQNIWTFTNGHYPVITALGIDEQAVALAYGLLRLASPNVGASTLDSFLGATLNNENIELLANSYDANDTLAILDVNLLQSNSATCTTNSTSSIITTRGANQAVVTMSITSATNNLHERIVYTGCNIGFDGAADISAGDSLQLAATITKGSAILSKKFVINFQ